MKFDIINKFMPKYNILYYISAPLRHICTKYSELSKQVLFLERR